MAVSFVWSVRYRIFSEKICITYDRKQHTGTMNTRETVQNRECFIVHCCNTVALLLTCARPREFTDPFGAVSLPDCSHVVLLLSYYTQWSVWEPAYVSQCHPKISVFLHGSREHDRVCVYVRLYRSASHFNVCLRGALRSNNSNNNGNNNRSAFSNGTRERVGQAKGI